uniref:Uncharacterized protein n=1 Tax=Globodera rostochiensis TaxID=31243 RepID=A0A914HN20_GLORO
MLARVDVRLFTMFAPLTSPHAVKIWAKVRFVYSGIIGTLNASLLVVMSYRYDARPIDGQNLFKNNNVPDGSELLSKFDKLKVSPTNFEKIRHLHDNLYHGAVKALVGQMGRRHYKQLTPEQQKLARCLDRIEARQKEVEEAAKCLMESRKRRFPARMNEKKEMPLNEKKEMPLNEKKEMALNEKKEMPLTEKKEMPLNEKKEIPLNEKKEMAKKEMAFVQEEEEEEHKVPIDQIKTKKNRLLRYMRRRKPRSLLAADQTDQRRFNRHKMADSSTTFINKATSMTSSMPLASPSDKPVGSRITNLIVKLLGERRQGERTTERWQSVHGRLSRFVTENERLQKLPGSKVFEKRMYDIVLERQEASASPIERHSHMALLQNGLKLIDLALANRTDSSSSSSRHNFRLFSPRFMPLMPDKGGLQHNNSLLSPTLLAMYEEHDNKSIGNVPEMLRKAGVGERERLGLIETLMDITGTTAKVDHALEMFKELNLFNEENLFPFLCVGGPLMESADRIVKAFFALEDSLDEQQKEQCEQNGYTFARKEQIEKLLRDQAVDLSKLPDMEQFDDYDRMSLEEKELALWATIEQIATSSSSSSSTSGKPIKEDWRRVKRSFATRVNEPTILSPFAFAPSHGLSVLGPTILSPSSFSPSILGPSILSPNILSPSIFKPAILSPSIMSPAILSPYLANPTILSPGLLGAFILNPVILTPFILSPGAMYPSILNPFALAPSILSPLILSPDIVSHQTLGGAIFSPVMLSPAIFTHGYLMVSIFSPSFLS